MLRIAGDADCHVASLLAMTVVIDGQSFCLGEAVFGTGRQFCELTGRVNAPPLQFFPFVFRCFSAKNIMPTYSFCMKHPCFLLALIVKLYRTQPAQWGRWMSGRDGGRFASKRAWAG